ncbi:hypothetical protein PPSIR1_22204 [Plesiocystis pacifica SIR-1]|uniref:Uncharacterized protein n=1 Tax=Plesiocystis pacifica SIR-1 TaxID=391625 RepID=A6FXT8_9BACT|nr:hypothetical protein PPSIR1_22204 [Plesiocystis pacifica SIR-1]
MPKSKQGARVSSTSELQLRADTPPSKMALELSCEG